jgi:hypothetical protein
MARSVLAYWAVGELGNSQDYSVTKKRGYVCYDDFVKKSMPPCDLQPTFPSLH